VKETARFWMIVVLTLPNVAQVLQRQPNDIATYNWSVSLDMNLTNPGQKIARLASCPKGVSGHGDRILGVRL
jgi:hypothetical protein